MIAQIAVVGDLGPGVGGMLRIKVHTVRRGRAYDLAIDLRT